MTGDPATQEWRQALGESTSARLRRVEAELGSALSALGEAQKERDEWKSTADQTVADIAAADKQIAVIEQERDDALHELEHARMKISQLETRLAYARQPDGKPCAYRGLAEELLREINHIDKEE